MCYYSIYCADPWLRARLCTDLQMSGFKKRYEEDPIFCPFYPANRWIYVGDDEAGEEFNCGCHVGRGYPIRLSLTKTNYLTILTEILQ